MALETRQASDEPTMCEVRRPPRIAFTSADSRRAFLGQLAAAGVSSALGSLIGCSASKDSAPQRKQPAAKNTHESEDAPIELADDTLLNHGVIRVGIKSNEEEKRRIRGEIKRALRIVLADSDLAVAYAQSKVVEHLVVPDLAQTLRQIIALAPDQFQQFDVEREIAQSAHGDAYTVAVETVGPDNKLLVVQNFMLLRAPLVQPENYPQLVVTLDHECRHIMLRGKRLSRPEEEIQVYTSGIGCMERVSRTLQKRGRGDAEIGRRILSEVLPIHRERLNSWKQIREGN